MKKILVSSVVALCVLGSTSMAEESGMFVGAEVGMGTIAFPGVKKTDFTQVGYGLVVGYKQFFTEDFGLRYYANFNHQLAGTKKNDVLPLDRLNYGFNVDDSTTSSILIAQVLVHSWVLVSEQILS